jgi:DNA-binding beta-propeller fold protein YncE
MSLVVVDALGSVYVADRANDRIQKFNSEGLFVTKWGSYGRGEGEFIEPVGVAVDGFGRVYVADTRNHRIQKFRPGGIAMVGNSPTIEWYSESGRTYKVWLSANLLDWDVVWEGRTDSATGINSWTDDGSHPLGSPGTALGRFYRIELLP